MTTGESQKSKRELILRAAAKQFEGRRFDEVTLDDIAAASGIGKGTLYLYFKNKEDLFARMAVDGLDDMAARTRAITAMTSPYKERLFLFGREFAEFLTKRHGVMRGMNQAQSAPVDRVFLKHLGRMIEAIHELLQAGMDEGALRMDFQTPELRSALVGPILLKIRREAHAGETINLNALLELFWAGAAKEKQ